MYLVRVMDVNVFGSCSGRIMFLFVGGAYNVFGSCNGR